MIRKIFYPLFLFIFIFCIFGCQKSAKDVKVLRVNFYEGAPESLNPQLVTSGHSMTLVKALFEGLTRTDTQGKVQLAIAKKITISPCGKKYFITLRNTKWSNGEEVTSTHFVQAWKNAVSYGSKCSRAGQFLLIKNVEKVYKNELPIEEVGIYAPSKNQIVVELEYSAPYFTQLLADPVFSPSYEDNQLEPKVFNGPFLIQNSDLERSIHLTANSKYWDADTVKLKNIHISFVRDLETAMSMYEKGELDWAGSPFSELSEEVVGNSDSLHAEEAFLPFWLYCNTQNPKLKSAKIRKALSYAIDREEISKHILAKQSPSYTILPAAMSLLKKEMFMSEKRIVKAQELLKEGLEEIGLTKEEFVLTLSYSSIPRHTKLAEFFKFSWEKVLGIPIILKKSDWNTFYTQIRTGDYEIGGYSTIASFNDPMNFIERFTVAELNFCKWESEEFRKCISLVKKSVSPEKRKEYLKIAENVLMDAMPVIPIYNHTHLFFRKASLKNLPAPKLAYTDFKWAYFDE